MSSTVSTVWVRQERRYARGTLGGVLVTMMSASAASEHSPWLQILTVFVTAAVVWPLLARLRRVISERRRARWSSDEATTPTSSSSPTLED